jgi:CPA2 family monovalent cation:H+ antiporter-2
MFAHLPAVIAVAVVPPFFLQVVALVVGAAVVAFVCNRLGLVPIVGFLVAGVLIGPFGLGWVRDRELVDAVADIGVVLLLFTIGIEFSLEKLARIQRLIFAGGGLQVGLATLATVAVLLPFGVDWRAAVFTGFLVSLSSTAIVLKLLAGRGETNSAHGQVGLGLLIFQDLAVIVMVLMIPTLAGRGGSPGAIVWALAKAGIIIAAVLVLARRFMPRLIEAVARTCSPEIFLLTVVAICLGTALLTSLAGVSLSLGAFLAGLLVSESRFSEYALGEILPLQVLFSAAFFVSVGMLLDLGFLVTHLPIVLAAIAAVLAIKVATTLVSVRALSFPLPVAAAVGLMLAQVGEFSFVLERSGRTLGLTPAGLGAAGSQTFIAATVVLMVLTPFLTGLGGAWAGRIERRRAIAGNAPAEPEPESVPEHVPALENHVIVSGYGEAARRLTRVLHGSGIPFLVVTLSPGGANEAEADGMIVLRGDSTRQRTLQLAGLERAKMLVIPDDDPATAHRIAMLARSLNPTMRIVVRTRFLSEIETLQRDGVDLVVAEELEGIVALFSQVLRDFQIPPDQIEAHQDAVRRGGYAALRAEEQPEVPVVECEFGDHCLDTRVVRVAPGTAAVGHTVRSLSERGHLAVRVERLASNGTVLEPPPDDRTIEAGDELTLVGSVEAFTRIGSLFRPAAATEDAAGSGGASSAAATATATAYARADRAMTVTAVPRPAPGVIDTEQTIHYTPSVGPETCRHLDRIHPVRPSARGCEDCIRTGDTWVHLRLCLTCGHVGCCDSSKNRHARAHWHAVGHPIIRSAQPGETWGWCFEDEVDLG